MDFGYQRVVEAFDKDDTAAQFLREDGEGGFAAGVYRMAREIERLRVMAYKPKSEHQTGCDCIQCIPF